jgi:uncharacterized protein YdhG (YjbR/CyaY superfamily)
VAKKTSAATPPKKPVANKIKNRPTAGSATAKDAAACLNAIAAMPPGDRVLAEGVHMLVQSCAPELTPRLWYGMPAYSREGKVVCFFQSASKFKTRYATLGFMHAANLDDGGLWPTAFALTAMTPVEQDQIRALLKKAIR